MEFEKHTLYPTIIYKARIPEMLPFHEEILGIVMSLVSQGDIDGGPVQTHVGYQTKPVLFERTEECFARLKHFHEVALKAYLRTDGMYMSIFKDQDVPDHRSVCWAYVQNEKQESSYIHHHGASGVSAVYYLKAPSGLEHNQGSISFIDPRGAGITSLLGCPDPSENSFHRPEEGTMILFPSWLQHRPLPMGNASGWRVSLGIDTNFMFRVGEGFRLSKKG